ncbi:MAG: PQQ-dependent sugar dehydrogenase [Casimicrobiaceae bacterium]
MTAILRIFLLMLSPVAFAQSSLPLDQIRLPVGFAIDVVARVPAARAMAWGARGTLFVGSQGENVWAVSWPGVTGTSASEMSLASAKVRKVGQDLHIPIGVAFRNGALYVSSVDRIMRYADIESHLDSPPRGTAIVDNLPTETHHGGRFIAFGPDGKLYVNIGAPCNICVPDAKHGLILRMNADGSARQVVARGVRNSVGFDWQPATHELWFTDNGRDNLGDDVPPDELNRVTRVGEDFGFPYCHAGTIADPEFGAKHPCSDFTAPVQPLGAHIAPLGMAFYTGTQFPAEYRQQIFIAEHGSWNRSSKAGYRVTLVTLDSAGHATGYRPFAQGWLQGNSEWGRPTDVLMAPDGSLLVADDRAGAIYRIRYTGN